MKLKILLNKALFLLIICISCAPKVKEGFNDKTGFVGTISISGAFALYPIVVLWGEDFKKLHPNVRFNISAGGAGKGIADVLTNMTDIGLVSRDLHPQELDKGAYPIYVAKDAVLGTFNSNHPNAQLIKERGLTRDELQKVFINGSYLSWNNIDRNFTASPIEIYVRSDAAGAAETWAKFFDKTQEDLKGVGIFGDPGVAQAIKDSPYAIGFNNINYVYDLKSKKTTPNIEVIPIDFNKNGKIDPEENFYADIDELTEAVALGKYPSPPTRKLLFVIKNDNTSKLIKEFIRFILHEDQQGYLLENGYVPLTAQQRAHELEKLNR